MKHDLRTETNRVFLAALVAELRFLRRPVIYLTHAPHLGGKCRKVVNILNIALVS